MVPVDSIILLSNLILLFQVGSQDLRGNQPVTTPATAIRRY
jgi:hypothetical protein